MDKKTNSSEPEAVTKDISPRRRAEQLMSGVKDGKLVAELFGQALDKQYTIHGKSLSDWRRHFAIKIPENPDPSQCKEIAAKLASNFHEAIFYYSLAEAQLAALTSGEFREYTKKFEHLVAEYRKNNPKKSLPAQKTLEALASAKMLDIKGAMTNARIAKDFWKRVLEGLTEVRKNLEIVTRNNYIQLQLEPRGIYPTPNRGGYGH